MSDRLLPAGLFRRSLRQLWRVVDVEVVLGLPNVVGIDRFLLHGASPSWCLRTVNKLSVVSDASRLLFNFSLCVCSSPRSIGFGERGSRRRSSPTTSGTARGVVPHRHAAGRPCAAVDIRPLGAVRRMSTTPSACPR